MDPATFTYEKLSEMKFNDLYKMTIQFNLVKRRVKKQELIEKLLTLKHQSIENQAEEKEWKNGSEVFKNVNVNENDEENRRSTFNVDKNLYSDPVDRRLTFEVPLDKSILLSSEDSRSTYEVPPKIELDSRATFEIPRKGEKLVSPPVVNSRETYEVPMSAKKLMEALGSNSRCEVHVEKLDMNKVDSKKEVKLVVKERKIKSPTRRARKDEILKKDSMKMSQKSILIKRTNKTTTPNKTVEMIKSPFKPRVKLMNLQASKTPLTKPKPKILETNTQSVKKLPKVDEDKLSEEKETAKIDKENVGRLLRRRKSKTEDNAVVKKPNPIRVNFFSPQVENRLRRSRISGQGTENRTENRISKIPKPTKMPDFATIHKRQFEQMDSLHDYKRKQEERARKLFGTPQPGPQNKESAKKPVTGIFQFRSTKVEVKEPASKFGKSIENMKKFGKSVENLRNVSPSKSKMMDSKAKKDAVKNKSAPRVQTDIKDRNRSHIHGVRTNKRFELQMKFRNL